MPFRTLGEFLARDWWVFLLRGIAAVLFSAMTFVLPQLTLLALVFLFGFYFILEGAMALMIGGRSRAWSLVIAGALGIVAGVLTFLYPGITAYGLLILFAVWALVRGIMEIVVAIRLRRELTGEWMLILGGALSVLVGLLLLIYPASGALAMVWLFGLYALLFGVTMCLIAFRLRRFRRRRPAGAL